MKQEDEDFRMARFGIEVEAFLESEIGKFIVEMAENKKRVAIEELKSIDVTNVSELTRIKNDIAIPDMVVGWLKEAIQAGGLAEQQIREEFEE